MNKPPETFGTVLSRIREQRGMSKTALAEALGLTFTTVYNWERGARVPPPMDRVRQIAEALTASREERNELLSLAAHARAPKEAAWVMGAKDNHGAPQPGNRAPLPLYTEIPVGPRKGSLAELGEVYHVLEHQAKPGRYVLKVCDDSMSPSVQDGDFVLMEYRDGGPLATYDNKICAVMLDGEPILKRVQVQQSGDRQIVMLKGERPDSPTESFVLGDREFKIVAIALEIVRRKLS